MENSTYSSLHDIIDIFRSMIASKEREIEDLYYGIEVIKKTIEESILYAEAVGKIEKSDA